MKTTSQTLFITFLLLFNAHVSLAALTGGEPSDTALDPSIMAIDEDKFLGAQLGKDYALIDEKGNEFNVGDMLNKPLVLLLSYYKCDGYCPTINNNLLETLKLVKYKIGEEYNVLTISFDENDDLKSLQEFSTKIGMTDDMRKGWRLAIMKNKADIKEFTSSVGYKFFWSSRDRIFLHPSVYIVASQKGKVVRFLYGTKIDEKDMELSIIDAYGEKLKKSKAIDFLTSVCYSYNFKEGKYTINYPLFIGLGSLFLGLSLVALSLFIYKKKRCV
ncbi:MAG: SCO family protein [Nitrospinae bacterium]|nr:SCO family protein [Nitrospinota bacterium]